MKLGNLLSSEIVATMRSVAAKPWEEMSPAERVQKLAEYLDSRHLHAKIRHFIDAKARRLCREEIPFGKKVMGTWIEDHACALMVEKGIDPLAALRASAADVLEFYDCKVKRPIAEQIFTEFILPRSEWVTVPARPALNK